MKEKLEYQFSIANYRNVIKIVNQLIEDNSLESAYELLMYKAAAYANLMEEEKAISVYKEIILSNPNEVQPKLQLALILIEIGEFESAKMQLGFARTIEPDNLDIINNQIYILEQLHEFQKVVELSTTAINIDRNEVSVWLTRAAAYERLQNYDLAISDGLKAIPLCEDEIDFQMTHNDLGYYYSKKGDLKNAEHYLRKAIEFDDTEPFQYNNLGLVLANKGNLDDGIKYINHSIRLDGNNSYAYKNRAIVYLKKDEFRKAKKDLIRAKEMDYYLNYDGEVNKLLLMLENHKQL